MASRFINYFNPLAMFRELGGTSTKTVEEKPKNGTSFKTMIQRVNSPQSALSLSAYYRAEELVSETIASLTMEYLSYSSTNGCFYKDMGRYRGSRLNHLLTSYPNPRQNAHQFFKTLVFRKRNTGDGFVWIQRDSSGEIIALWCLTCNAVYNYADNTWSFHDTNLQLHKENVPDADMIHIRQLNGSSNSVYGQSIITNARQALAVAATLQEENKNRIATGGRQKGFISFDTPSVGLGQYAEEQKKKAVEQVRQDIEDYDIMLLPRDAKWMPSTLSSADLQFIESEKFSIADISRYTGVPMSLLSDAAGSVYKSQTETFQIFIKGCIMPILHEIECEFNSKCVFWYESGTPSKFEFNRRPLLNTDPKTEAEIDKILLESGVICPNELRAKHNLAPVEKGDIHYVSTNLAELGSDKLRGGEAPTEPTPEPEPEPKPKRTKKAK